MTKYRGLRLDGKGWVEGFLIGMLDPTIEKDTVKHWLIHSGVNISTGDKVHKDSIAISFGQTDKNGKEIFGSIDGSKGGDRVKYKQSEKFGESVNEYTTDVVFEGYGFTPMKYHVECEDGFYSCLISDIEIIGNQYEPQDSEIVEKHICKYCGNMTVYPDDECYNKH